MRTPESLDPAVERELAALDAALAGSGDDPVLAELAALMREERPAPTPRWADALDERVAAGFPRPKRRWPRVRLGFGPAMAAVATIFLVVLVSAVTLGGGLWTSTEQMSGGASGAAGEEPAAMQEDGAAVAPSAPRSGPAVGADGVDQRLVERSAYLTLAAPGDELAAVGDRIIATTDRLGGFVAASSVQSGDSGGGGTFELRIPQERLDRLLADLSRLAHVRERAQATQDITGTTVRARDRLSDARAERRALRRALDRAQTRREAARLRYALRRVDREIDAAERAVRTVEARATFATVQVALVADDSAGGAAAPGDGRWTPGEAFGDAVRVLEVVAGVALVALAAALPFLVLLGAVLAARRWRMARFRERALDAV